MRRFTRSLIAHRETGRLLMNLLLLRSGYPIVVIRNRDRTKYSDGLVAVQQRQSEELLLELMTESIKVALIKILGIVPQPKRIAIRN